MHKIKKIGSVATKTHIKI